MWSARMAPCARTWWSHLPEGRDVVVDVKTPLDAYLAAAEAATDEVRAVALRRHAQHVADRVRMLSSKNYAAQFDEAPQFVVLFLPGDQFLPAALDQQPDLLDRAMSSNIILDDAIDASGAAEGGAAAAGRTCASPRMPSASAASRRTCTPGSATFRNHLGKIGALARVEPARVQCGRGIARAQRAARRSQVRGTGRSRRQAHRGTRRNRSQCAHCRRHDAPARFARRALTATDGRRS